MSVTLSYTWVRTQTTTEDHITTKKFTKEKCSTSCNTFLWLCIQNLVSARMPSFNGTG